MRLEEIAGACNVLTTFHRDTGLEVTHCGGQRSGIDIYAVSGASRQTLRHMLQGSDFIVAGMASSSEVKTLVTKAEEATLP